MLTRIPISLVILSLVTFSAASDDTSSSKASTEPNQQRSLHADRWNSYIDRQIADPLTFHYLWPWSQLFQAVAALDEDAFNEPKVVSSKEKFEVLLNVKRFKPDEVRIRVKGRNIIVEGKHKERTKEDKHYVANHFVQNLILPAGSKAEEVKAVLKDGILKVTVPRHELPPPPPEREVPIEVIITEKASTEEPSTEKVEVTSTTEKIVLPDASSTVLPEQLELIEATTHAGKIRKKELKQPKPSKTNKVSKGVDENGLDYALIDTE